MEEKVRVSVKQIAEAAGVSQSTASLVLNNRGAENRIAPETQEKVRKIAEELGYRPRKRARQECGKRDPVVIGILQPTDLESGPLPQFFAGAMNCIRDRELNYELMVVLYQRGELEKKKHLFSTDRYFRGVIILGASNADVEFLQEFSGTIPVVVFNRGVKGYHALKIDDYEVGQYACTHFLKRNHRKLCLVTPDYSSKSLSMRLVGFMDEFYSFMGKREPRLPVIKEENTEEGGYLAAKRILQEEDCPTAVFVTNDQMVRGLVKTLLEAGKRIPRDMEIISFGNKALNVWNHPQITSFDYPVETMAYDSIQILRSEIEDGPMSPVTRNYTASCVFRESCPKEEYTAFMEEAAPGYGRMEGAQ